MLRPYFLSVVLIIGLFSYGQDTFSNAQGNKEQSLSSTLNDLRAAKTDEKINSINEVFKEELSSVLASDWAFDYPFTSLTTIGKIFSDDREIRIISWNIQFENGAHKYHAYILKKKGRRGGHDLIELIDNSKNTPQETQETVSAENWYGALYYNIKDVQKGRKTYYTLFGYDAKNDRSTLKMLDVLYFVGKNPKFGYPLFETPNGYAKRVYFEHSAKAVMSLKYDERQDMIIFDHLSPEAPNLVEFREFYVPDMSYDAYKFENNKWRLKEDIIAVNSERKNESINLMGYDAATDSVRSVQVKSKWIDPTDKGSPIESGSHKAVLPDETKDTKKKKKAKKKAKKRESKFSGVSFSNLPKDKKRKRKKRH